MKIKMYSTLIVILMLFGASELNSQSLLWEVSGNGLEQPSFLFGTIHLICSEDFMMDDRILSALETSEHIVMEMDMTNPNLQMEMQQNALNPNMENVSAYMSEEEIEKMNALLAENYGMELGQIGMLKPFMLTSMLIITQLNCEEEIASYEMFFVEQAQKLDLESVGLESVQFQTTLFDEIPLDEQVKELVKIVNVPEEGQQQFQDMLAFYLDEDLDGLHKIISEDDYYRRYSELLLDQRNKTWIKPISEWMEKGTSFIAVGSGHLAGKSGVIQLLKNEGYTVKPVISE